jgi:nicotinamide-nucleotide amidase
VTGLGKGEAGLSFMRIELINTGTELVLGDTINTNAAWIGQRLAALGLKVARQTIVPDGAVIGEVLAEAAGRSEVVITTGGLGPTNDDVTREITAGLLGLPMDLDEGVKKTLETYFHKRGREVNAATLRQAMVPRGARVLENAFGTAPGLYVPAELGRERGWACHFFLLPGPPRELKPMVEHGVEPVLKALHPEAALREVIYLKVTGMGESDIVDHIERDLEAMAGDGLEMGYCIGRGDVDVRLAGGAEVVARGAALVRERIGDYILSEDRRVIEEVVVDLLRQRREWVATAESCTGGMIAGRLTDVSGASAVFGYGFVTYANEAKVKELGVPAELLMQHGAVSELVARAMAEGCLGASGADHALAVTGVAGPTGGSEEKPVGTVFVALASKSAGTICRRLFFPGARDRFKLLTSQAALEMVRRRLCNLPLES